MNNKKSKAGFLVLLILGNIFAFIFFFLMIGFIGMGENPFVFVVLWLACLVSVIFSIINLIKVGQHNRKIEEAEKAKKRKATPAPTNVQSQGSPKNPPETKEQSTIKEMFPCGMLQPPGIKVFGVIDDAILYGDEKILFSQIEWLNWATAPTVATNGIAQMKANGKIYQLCYKFADRERAASAISYAKSKIEEAHGVSKNWLYHISAHTGTTLEVYDSYLIINFMRVGGVGTMTANILSGGGTGGKRINFADITAIQFKEPAGVTVGFIQFAYPGSREMRDSVLAAIDDENAIPVSPQNLEEARKIVEFIENKRMALKNGTPQVSSADELKKFKELFDSGVITQEEFEAKKKQLLGL